MAGGTDVYIEIGRKSDVANSNHLELGVTADGALVLRETNVRYDVLRVINLGVADKKRFEEIKAHLDRLSIHAVDA